MVAGDGNGWVDDPETGRWWGKYGAAGLLVRAPDQYGNPLVLMQHRSPWGHHGGTWSIPGGARDSHESAIEAALREGREEACLPHDPLIRAVRVTFAVAVGWSYTTVIADFDEPVKVQADRESLSVTWVAESEVAQLNLHPGFVAAWPFLRVTNVTSSKHVQEKIVTGTEYESIAWGTREAADGRFVWVNPECYPSDGVD